jgi:hypothetical protein
MILIDIESYQQLMKEESIEVLEILEIKNFLEIAKYRKDQDENNIINNIAKLSYTNILKNLQESDNLKTIFNRKKENASTEMVEFLTIKNIYAQLPENKKNKINEKIEKEEEEKKAIFKKIIKCLKMPTMYFYEAIYSDFKEKEEKKKFLLKI